MNRLNRVYLIRHGQVNGYEDFPVYGHTDVDLTETGILQMDHMAERLRYTEIHAIYGSNLKRSAAGARIIARYHDAPVRLLPELREMFFGDWEGRTLAQIQDQYPAELKRRQQNLLDFEAPGGGEPLLEFDERIGRCFKQIRSESQGKNAVIVAHGGVNRIVLCRALGLDLTRMFSLHQDYGCLNIIDYFPDFELIRLVNG